MEDYSQIKFFGDLKFMIIFLQEMALVFSSYSKIKIYISCIIEIYFIIQNYVIFMGPLSIFKIKLYS